MWITSGNQVAIEEERHHVLAANMYTLAVHADPISLREGVTFVIDMSQSTPPPKIGNEGKMQKVYQCYPLRPQQIMIAGTNMFTTIIVNASIKVASLFSKQKVLNRIRFVTVEDAVSQIPESSVPKYLGGPGGGHASIERWVQERLQHFPCPEL
jgi:hypothetical protein